MKMEERITIHEASEILGIPAQSIRTMMRKKEIDIGLCVQTGEKNHSYYIFRRKVMKLVGREPRKETS